MHGFYGSHLEHRRRRKEKQNKRKKIRMKKGRRKNKGGYGGGNMELCGPIAVSSKLYRASL